MKRSSLLPLFALLFVVGCASVDRVVYDTTIRQPTTAVEVFKDGKMPNRKYKEIAELLMPGHREDELIRQQKMIEEARRIGGDGLIFVATPAGIKASGTIFQTTEWIFKGKVIVFE